MKAVSDSGPLIHLAEIQAFSLLSIFQVLHIPDAVWNETVEYGRISKQSLLEFNQMQRHTLVQNEVTIFLKEHGLSELHLGESEGLYLCKSLETSLFSGSHAPAWEPSMDAPASRV